MRHCSSAGGFGAENVCPCCVQRVFWPRLPLPKQTPRRPCLPRLPVRSNLRPRPSHSRRKRRRSRRRSRLPTRDPFTLKCRIHTIRLRRICPALCRNSTCKTRSASTTSFRTASSASPCEDAIALALENNLMLAAFRYNFPIAQADLQRTKAGGIANGVNTASSRPRRAALALPGAAAVPRTPRVRPQAPAASSPPLSAQARPFPRSTPSLNFNGFVNHTRHPGGERFPGRHPNPEDKQYRGPIAVLTVFSARHLPAGQLHRPAHCQQQPL